MKALKIQVIAVIIVLLSACSFLKNEKAIIKDEKLVEVLTDIHLADASLVVKGYHVRKDTLKIERFYSYILEKHEVTPAQLKTALEYYAKHTEEYDKIYDQVLNNLSKLESEVNEQSSEVEKP